MRKSIDKRRDPATPAHIARTRLRMLAALLGYSVASMSGAVSAQSGTTVNITWNATFNVPSRVVESGLTTDFTYDASGRLIQLKQTDTTGQTVPFSTNGRTRVWAYSYFSGDLLSSVDGPLAGTGDTTSYTYNSNGYIKTVVNEVGQTATVTAWNALGQPSSVTGVDGVVTSYAYDGMGRLTSVAINPGSSQTAWSMTYTPVGDLATLTEPAGAVYTLTWDNARRLTQIVNNAGETIAYSRDAMGNETGRTITAADGSTQMFSQAGTFDELGRLIKQVGGENRIWSFAYDKTSNLTAITDPRAKTMSFGFDAVNRLISETERDGGVVKHGYNGKDEETTYTDPRNLATTYVRNGFGEVIQETSSDRGTTVYDYDARGLMISKKDARGTTVTYSYDNAGRLTGRTYPTAALNETFAYDGTAAGATGKGRLTRMTDAGGSSQYSYDGVGRVIGEVRQISTKTFTTSYTYDQGGTGKLLYITYPSGRDVSYNYDAMGRVSYIGVKFPGVAEQSIVTWAGYYPFSGLRGLAFANGLSTWSNRDHEYQPAGMQLAPASGGASLIDRYFSYGDGLNLTRINNDNIDSSQTQSFGYDQAARLSSGSGPYGSRTYTYDRVGNRLSEAKTVSGTTTSQTYAYPSNSNRLGTITQGSTTVRSFAYDAAGSQTGDTRSGTAYAYTINDAGRIAQVKVGGTVKANYTYDGRNRLSVRQTLNMTPAGTTYVLHDVWDHVIAETDGTGQVIREYIWLGDTPIAVVDGSSSPSSPTLLWVHTDHLGRPEMMTDASKAVKWKAVYEPFGTVSSITGAAALQMRFPGQWFQLETGVAYNWYRHYDSTTGRYTQVDPFGRNQGPRAPTLTSNLSSYYNKYNVYKIYKTALNIKNIRNDVNSIHSSFFYPVYTDVIDSEDFDTKNLSLYGKRSTRDGVSLYNYAWQSPLSRIDPYGLATPRRGTPWGFEWVSNSTCRFYDGNGNADYDIDIPGHHYDAEWHGWYNGRRGPANPF